MPKLRDARKRIGRGAFHAKRSGRITDRGLHGSDYADMSNDKQSENLCRRNPKVSRGRLIRPGLVDPKSRPDRRR